MMVPDAPQKDRARLAQLADAHLHERADDVDDALKEIEKRRGLAPAGEEMRKLFDA